MTREQLEHVVRAAAAITGDSEIVVIGSTAILGQFPNAPAEMLGSIEADIYPRNHPVPTQGDPVSGLCLEVHDLVLSKYVASREKDRAFNRAAIRHGFVQRDVLLDRLGSMDVDPAIRKILRERIDADFSPHDT